MAPVAPELARRLADALEAAGVPHAIGGALALAVWGFPRATNDVDLDVFVAAADVEPVLRLLAQCGAQFDPEAAARSARERGDLRVVVEGMRVDVFISCLPFYDSVQARVRRGPLEGRPAWYLSP